MPASGRCTDCRGQGWTSRRRCDDTDDSRGPHLQVSESPEPSQLTQEQATVWETERQLPAVRLLLTTLLVVFVAFILYSLIRK